MEVDDVRISPPKGRDVSVLSVLRGLQTGQIQKSSGFNQNRGLFVDNPWVDRQPNKIIRSSNILSSTVHEILRKDLVNLLPQQDRCHVVVINKLQLIETKRSVRQEYTTYSPNDHLVTILATDRKSVV